MERIPILDLKRQIAPIRQELDAAIKKIIDQANFVLGKEIADFENSAIDYTKAKFACAVSNGTDAIRLSLLAVGVEPGDKVLCPAFTYYATAAAIASIGAVPVLTEIDPNTYNILPEEIARIAKKKKIKAAVPVHLYGQCADMDNILQAAKKYNIKVVEDTAQAFGASYKGRKAGTIGDCGAISFFPGKNLGGFGDSGMVLSNSKKYDDTLRLLRNQGNKEKYNHVIIGYNHRMDTLQAAILNVKLKYLDSWNRRRQETAAYYNQALKGLNLALPFVPDYNEHIYHQYVFRVKNGRDKLMQYLIDKGIDARVYYPQPIYLQKPFRYLGYRKGDFAQSEKAARQVLAIPVYPDLTREEKEYIVAAIKEFFRC
ncbi:MAG: DegT/DnrJ/EryC1/StrS family aminotransferase [Candidatus Omnitrophica bacterium]|nr:DegT/DnrJ/EryC1/StrS family aminotransferase [Candidatus Omnitrophota bacterium]MDD5652656.1 DegT/DnrJ/EryC1/StrS family aminotransferase [Candidatus Omnitrophota bacterium]